MLIYVNARRSLNERKKLDSWPRHPHAPTMFVVSEAEAAAIRAVFQRSDELSAAMELRRLFPGITDNAQARECARTIAGWQKLHPLRRVPKVAGEPRQSRVRSSG